MTKKETIPQMLINAGTGEQHVIQLKPRKGLTVADVEAFLADRRDAGKLIDPQNCEVFKEKTEVLDPYWLFDVPDEWSCVGSSRFVRNLPDGSWVWFGDLPPEILNALRANLEQAIRSTEKPELDDCPF